MTKPVALTTGDPAGIGPELSLKVALDRATTFPPLLIGSVQLLERVATKLSMPVSLRQVSDVSEVVAAEPGAVYVWDVAMSEADDVQPGVVSARCGDAAVQAIRVAADLAMRDAVIGVASAPANKEAFNAAGHHYEGQTEIFAALTDTDRFHTILVGGPLRVSLISAHCSMQEAIRRVNKERVTRILMELHAAMKNEFRIEFPRIGVAGLNPHAGENGVLGREELDEVVPAVQECRTRGVDASLPLAADSLFNAAENGKYDAVLAMYHDQGAIPLKRYGYVTYAAGLPIVRTTAGHGTAFDIAWSGKASDTLLSRAVELAHELGSQRSHHAEVDGGGQRS